MEGLKIVSAVTCLAAMELGKYTAWFFSAAFLACSISSCVNPLHVAATVSKTSACVTGCCSALCCFGGTIDFIEGNPKKRDKQEYEQFHTVQEI